ncbi:DNA uptake porin HofQ [Scandinavium sp.]|uniref:DNA uptake porin HofQ n=1 Tax=Scandinavium sp. TaxID=2830653 RepID=UPI0028999BF0|nr:DNA uptake porin HofQ [Scandinavium sp.]
MIRRIALGLIMMVFGALAKEKTVSLMVDDVPVTQVIQTLATLGERNIVIAPEVSGQISLQLNDVSWKQALQTVMSSAGLVLDTQSSILFVHTKAWLAEKSALKDAERQKRSQALPLQGKSVILHYADAAELAKAGEKLLSERGAMTVDKRTNRLLVRDDNQHLADLLAWAQEMDIPVGQVELRAHIVTINKKSLRELGVKWSLADAENGQGSGKVAAINSDLSAANATTYAGFNIGKISGRLLELELSALEQKQELEIIASPHLLASHLQPASIKQGTEIPYQVSSGESGATSVEFKEAVLGMEVTPTVLQKNRVRLKLKITEDMPGQVLQQADGEVLAIDKQEIETQVEVRSGETLALGGIFSQKNKSARSGIPLLGDIPWLGRLFRHDGKDSERRELVVFITPRIISAQ